MASAHRFAVGAGPAEPAAHGRGRQLNACGDSAVHEPAGGGKQGSTDDLTAVSPPRDPPRRDQRVGLPTWADLISMGREDATESELRVYWELFRHEADRGGLNVDLAGVSDAIASGMRPVEWYDREHGPDA